MPQRGLTPNEFTYSDVFASCGALEEYLIGKKVHCLALEAGFDLIRLVSILLFKFYAAIGDVLDTRKTFDGFSMKSVGLCNNMMDLHVGIGDIISARNLFDGINTLFTSTLHSDNSFLYTDPLSCTGLWLALEDASIINGCLWAIPGSHKNGLVRRFIRDENGFHFDRDSPSYDQKEFVPLEIKADTLVVIHDDLIHQSFENIHQSFENKSPASRHALSLHVVDTDGYEWAKDNWIRRKTAPEPLYVS